MLDPFVQEGKIGEEYLMEFGPILGVTGISGKGNHAEIDSQKPIRRSAFGFPFYGVSDLVLQGVSAQAIMSKRLYTIYLRDFN